MNTIPVYAVTVLVFFISTAVSGVPNPDDSKLNSSSSTISTLPLLIHDGIRNNSMKSKNNSDIYGKTDAEQLDELSVIDVIFRKRSHDDDQTDNKATKTGKDGDPVSVEEVEVVSYEEISSEEDDNKGEVRSKVVVDTYIASEAPTNDITTTTSTTDDYSVKEEVFIDISLTSDGDLKPPLKGARSVSSENYSNPRKTDNKLRLTLADLAAGLR